MHINIRSYIREKSAQINKVYQDEAESKAVCEQLLMYHLHRSTAELYLKSEIEIDINQHNEIEADFKKLNQHVPLQYITGEAPFRTLLLKIYEGVLIPRPETEELIDLLIKMEDLNKNTHILDACTGSGCIAISLKSEFPDIEVSAFDVDKNVLALAKSNSDDNNTTIQFFLHDLLKMEKTGKNELFNVIISNPPYVLESEKERMAERVLQYEPGIALFVEDNDPLIFYKNIINQFGSKNCRYYFEINPLTIQKWEDFGQESRFNLQFFKDINGKTRFVRIQ